MTKIYTAGTPREIHRDREEKGQGEGGEIEVTLGRNERVKRRESNKASKQILK